MLSADQDVNKYAPTPTKSL